MQCLTQIGQTWFDFFVYFYILILPKSKLWNIKFVQSKIWSVKLNEQKFGATMYLLMALIFSNDQKRIRGARKMNLSTTVRAPS